jgi:hypothetical protein
MSSITKQVGTIPNALAASKTMSISVSCSFRNGSFREQQLEQDRISQEEYLAFPKKHGAPLDEKYLWDKLRLIIRSYRTLRDGSF